MEGERYRGFGGEGGGGVTFISLMGQNDGPKEAADRRTDGWTEGRKGGKRWKRKSGEWGHSRIEHPLESDMEIALTGSHGRQESQTPEEKPAHMRAHAHAHTHHITVYPGHSETLKGGISHTHSYTGRQGFREQTNTPRGFTRRNHCARASPGISHED